MLNMSALVPRFIGLLNFFITCCITTSISACSRDDYFSSDIQFVLDDSISVEIESLKRPYKEWTEMDKIEVNVYASLGFIHQSAAVYGDYAFFVNNGRSQILLYNLSKKKPVFTLCLSGMNGSIYHCNQSTFGFDKFSDMDVFPLLYISQRAKSDGRCFIEAYRIFPLYNEDLSEIESFSIELVQTIFLPQMSYDNSLGNANCAIDVQNKVMFLYSRNNNSKEDNFGQCKITQFAVPNVNIEKVVLQNTDIISSFMIDASAVNMQGGCIKDGILYIGQGSPSEGSIYLNIIDLKNQFLVRRIDLTDYKVNWEPEGCFFYDGSVMLSHLGAICRIDK